MTSTVPLKVVPDALTPEAAEVYVTVSIAGREYDLILDTGGASSRIVGDDFTRQFETAPPEDDPGRGVFGGSSASASRVLVPELRFGSIAATGLSVELTTESNEEHGAPAILGLDILRSHRLDVRLGQGTLTIDGSDPVDRERPLLVSSRGHPVVEVNWIGHTARAVWDTGAGVTVVDTAFARAHHHLFSPHATAVATDSHGNSSETPLVTMAACSIGGREFGATVAAIADIAGIQRPGDPRFELILGYPVISQANWSIDLRNGTWGFLPDQS
jgi:hypothetical protein